MQAMQAMLWTGYSTLDIHDQSAPCNPKFGHILVPAELSHGSASAMRAWRKLPVVLGRFVSICVLARLGISCIVSYRREARRPSVVPRLSLAIGGRASLQIEG